MAGRYHREEQLGYSADVTLLGLFGRPFVDLGLLLDLSGLDQVHEEICLALARTPVEYTGGSHRTMGIMPKGHEAEALGDYGEAIRGMTAAQFEVFRSLADEPDDIPEDARDSGEFGEERDYPLSRRQMLWLKVRFGVYFPWKSYVELIPNRYWKDKSDPTGKDFTARAKTFFPKTIAFIRTLPLTHVGRANIMGLEGNDHGTLHRDGEPNEQKAPDHFITLCPAQNKRLYVWDEVSGKKTNVTGRAVWFNDFDFHGVDAEPHFRYSLRVDGIFQPDFLSRVEAAARTT
jgi:hypothetical protein